MSHVVVLLPIKLYDFNEILVHVNLNKATWLDGTWGALLRKLVNQYSINQLWTYNAMHERFVIKNGNFDKLVFQQYHIFV